jgi:hypothetical protein
MYPLGGQVGARTVADVDGYNLRKWRFPLDTQSGSDRIRQASFQKGDWASSVVSYAVDASPECDENEPNNTVSEAQRVESPVTVNGRIDRLGDVDVFRVDGKDGQEIVVEVFARRLHSPLDSILRLSDASGKVLEWNDDHEDKECDLLTHHADSCLRAQLPEDGAYYVELADQQHQGGEACAYRLSIAPPQPDFALRIIPSSVNALAGRAVPVRVHALRKDGFDGEIEVALKDAPEGYTLDGGRIPKGKDSIRMTLTVPRRLINRPASLQF